MGNEHGWQSIIKVQNTLNMSVTSGFSYKSNVREDVQEAYKQLVQTILGI